VENAFVTVAKINTSTPQEKIASERRQTRFLWAAIILPMFAISIMAI